MCCTNQPNKNKLALRMPLIHIYTIHFSYIGRCGGHGHCMHTDVFKRKVRLQIKWTQLELKNNAVLNLYYVLINMWSLVTCEMLIIPSEVP